MEVEMVEEKLEKRRRLQNFFMKPPNS